MSSRTPGIRYIFPEDEIEPIADQDSASFGGASVRVRSAIEYSTDQIS